LALVPVVSLALNHRLIAAIPPGSGTTVAAKCQSGRFIFFPQGSALIFRQVRMSEPAGGADEGAERALPENGWGENVRFWGPWRVVEEGKGMVGELKFFSFDSKIHYFATKQHYLLLKLTFCCFIICFLASIICF
jgi:hypothetical protein